MGGWGDAKSHDGEKAWSSINNSIFSGRKARRRKQKTKETKDGSIQIAAKHKKYPETNDFEIERWSYSNGFEIDDVKNTERIGETAHIT